MTRAALALAIAFIGGCNLSEPGSTPTFVAANVNNIQAAQTLVESFIDSSAGYNIIAQYGNGRSTVGNSTAAQYADVIKQQVITAFFSNMQGVQILSQQEVEDYGLNQLYATWQGVRLTGFIPGDATEVRWNPQALRGSGPAMVLRRVGNLATVQLPGAQPGALRLSFNVVY